MRTRIVLLAVLCWTSFAFAGTSIYQGGNTTTMLTPSSSGTSTQQTGGANLRFNPQGGVVSVLGDLTVSQLSTPSAPTITPQGTTGVTSYGYTVVALTGTGHTAASSETTIATGNATLTSTNFNRITWTPVLGASGYDVYRTTGGVTQGKINTSIVTAAVFDDTGLSASGAAPTTNTTGTFTTAIGGSAPTDATYITQTANGTLTNEQALGALATGILKNTTGTGVLSIAGAGDFPTLNQNTTGNAATVTTNANLTGHVTSSGNATVLGSFSSANLSGALTDETGSGAAVFATSPSIASPIITTKIGLPRVTAFPSSPSAGDTVIVTNDSAVGACDSAAGSSQSLCQYNGTGWVSLGDGGSGGGSTITAAGANVNTGESTTSTTFTDLTTTGPTVTVLIGPSGKLLVSINARLSNNTANKTAAADFALSGGNTRSAWWDTAVSAASASTGLEISIGRTVLFTGLSSTSTTITMKYSAQSGSDTATFWDRRLNVLTW